MSPGWYVGWSSAAAVYRSVWTPARGLAGGRAWALVGRGGTSRYSLYKGHSEIYIYNKYNTIYIFLFALKYKTVGNRDFLIFSAIRNTLTLVFMSMLSLGRRPLTRLYKLSLTAQRWSSQPSPWTPSSGINSGKSVGVVWKNCPRDLPWAIFPKNPWGLATVFQTFGLK